MGSRTRVLPCLPKLIDIILLADLFHGFKLSWQLRRLNMTSNLRDYLLGKSHDCLEIVGRD